MEGDGEIAGTANSYIFAFRDYDPRIGRMKSIDPLFRQFPWYSPYQFAGNSPVMNIDLEGAEPHPYFYLPRWAQSITDAGLWVEQKVSTANGVAENTVRAYETVSGQEPTLYQKTSAYLNAYLTQFGTYTSTNDVAVLTQGRNLDNTDATGLDYTFAAAGVFLPISGNKLKQGGEALIEGFIKVWKNGDEALEKAYKFGNLGHKGSKSYREAVDAIGGGGNFVASSKEQALDLLNSAFKDIPNETGKATSKFGYRIDDAFETGEGGLKQGHQGLHVNYYNKEEGVKGTIIISNAKE